MQNQNYFYQPNLTNYDSGIYGRYNNFPYPYNYIPKQMNNSLNEFLSDEENINPNGFYFLTDKNGSMNNEKIINTLLSRAPYTFSNSQTNAIEINHLSGINKKIENSNKKLSRKNDVRLINNSARMHSNEGVKIDYNLFNKDINKDYKLKKKYSSIATGNNLNENDNFSFYNNINNNSYSCYNHQYTKNNSHRIDNQINNNYLIKDYKAKHEYKEKCLYDNVNKEIKFDSFNYNNGKCITITEKDKIYNNNDKQEYNCLKKEEMLNNKIRHMSNINNNGNLIKIVKSNKSNNKKENKKAYKPPINKNISYPKIEAFNFKNKFKRINSQNENKKKMRIDIINSNNNILSKPEGTKNIKIINLGNLQDCNENNRGKKNHSFYEIKTLSKDLFNHNNDNIQSKNNNNEMISIVYKNNNKSLYDKTDKEKIKKISSSSINENICPKDNLKLKPKSINFTKLNAYLKNKEAKPYNIPKRISKNLFTPGNKSEIKINYPNSTKENINTINSNLNYNYNNFFVQDKVKQEKRNSIVKIDRLKSKNNKENISLKKNPSIDNNEKKIINCNNEKVNNKHLNSRENIGNALKLDKHNMSNIRNMRKIDSNSFSFFPAVKVNEINKKNSNKNIKKNKKLYSKKNLIQLTNINKKTYEEDFPLNINNNKKILNNLLKPQISFRIALFSKKEPEYEKYFLVNTFFSANMRDKPEGSESDF